MSQYIFSIMIFPILLKFESYIKCTCQCETDNVDRNSIHSETRESQNVSPGIHNGRFRRLEPPDNILFEILQRFCTDEAIKRKEEGKVF